MKYILTHLTFSKKTLATSTVALLILLSLISPVNVLADETPPPPLTPEETIAPVSTSTPEDILIPTQTVEAATSPTLDLVLTDTPSPETTEPTEVPLTTTTISDVLPPETEILVQVDDELQPLASQAAQTAIAVGDPIWCPEGALPIINTGGCTASYSDLYALIDDIDSGNIPEPTSDGVIWVLSGTDVSSSAIVIDGSVFTNWRNYELTIQGGWDGTSSTVPVGNSVFSVPISVINWLNVVTVNQIEISNTTQTGLTVETTSDINIDGLIATDNALNGAELSSQGSVTITGANNFDDNTLDGLYIEAAGDVDMNSIEASGNGGAGAQIFSLGGSVSLSGVNLFEDNDSYGLYTEAVGDIDLENITASSNGANGININSSSGGVSLSGTNTFEDNDDSGLYIEALTDVDVENVLADGNGAGGVFGSGAEIYTQGNVSVSGTNEFDNNNDDGLFVDATGTIDVENITAEANNNNGIELHSTMNVSLMGSNVFADNGATGLYIETAGNVNAENIAADNNANGAEIYSTAGSVTLTGINNFSDSALGTGLYIEAITLIDLENITADGNASNGAELNSQSSVVVSGDNVFSDNATVGLYVSAVGDISVENITADNNGSVGVNLDSVSGNINITGINDFTNNNDTGLYVETSGSANLENITANGNGAGGIVGNGAEIYAQSNVTLSGVNMFTNNHDTGLFIENAINVSSENISAIGNGDNGVEISASGIVGLTGTNIFNNNNNFGLYVEAGNNINATNLSAIANGENGVALYTLADVSVTGTNLFNSNGSTGLYVEATGDVNLQNLTANNNGVGLISGSGAEIYSLGNIALTGANLFNNNLSTGVTLSGINSVYAEYTDASLNGSSGLFIESNGNANVLCGVLSNNASYELEADVSGMLTLTGVNFGWDIDNDLGADEDRLTLISNSCFTYPPPDIDIDTPDIHYPPINNLPISAQYGTNGNVINLNCVEYKGTILTLVNGNGAYIPCPLVDSARLAEIPDTALAKIPQDMEFISAFILDIYKDGKAVDFQYQSGLIDFSGANNLYGSKFTYVYWNGNEWVEVTDQSYPYMTVFFIPPKEDVDIKSTNYAILYWDGTQWLELVDNLQIGNGRLVDRGGHIDEALHFSSTVNFTGTFVFVRK